MRAVRWTSTRAQECRADRGAGGDLSLLRMRFTTGWGAFAQADLVRPIITRLGVSKPPQTSMPRAPRRAGDRKTVCETCWPHRNCRPGRPRVGQAGGGRQSISGERLTLHARTRNEAGGTLKARRPRKWRRSNIIVGRVPRAGSCQPPERDGTHGARSEAGTATGIHNSHPAGFI